MRASLGCMCHVPGTDCFTSSPKDAAQDAPTHWIEKLIGLFTVQDEPTYLAEKLSGLCKAQSAPTPWVEKLSVLFIVQAAPTHWVEKQRWSGIVVCLSAYSLGRRHRMDLEGLVSWQRRVRTHCIFTILVAVFSYLFKWIFP